MKKTIIFVFIIIMFSCLRGQNNTFTDINAGLQSASNGSLAWGDYDNDGDLDILIGNIIYRNNGNSTFTDINAGLSYVGSGSVAWGDYDNDGNLDILLTGSTGSYPNYNPISKIYHNNGNSTFTDINAGLIGVMDSSVAWGDYDNDGDLDVLLAGRILAGSYFRSCIYNNNGNNTFTYIDAGLMTIASGSVAWGDYDNDGDLDILLSGQFAQGGLFYTTRVYHNNGNGSFTDINAGLIGVMYSSTSWGDYNNDGYLDIIVSGYVGNSTYITKVYHNNGNSTFSEIDAGLPGVGSGSSEWGDYDNDGDLDILLTGQSDFRTNISQIYNNNGNGTFSSINAGLASVFGSSIWGDYDNDGDLDILLGSGVVYRNDGGTNQWLKIKTRGVSSNSGGLGARVRCGTINSQYREISSSSGWTNSIAHFGIGSQNTVDQTSVYWPQSGITDTNIQIQANQTLIIFEGNLSIINIYPNGGEVLPGAIGQNNTYPVTWSIENPPVNLHHIKLLYSLDGGLTYPYLIADNEVNDGIYNWTVPNINSSSLKMKILTVNNSGVVIAEKCSSSSFSIDISPPTGSISLTAPINGAWVSQTPYFDWSALELVDVSSMAIIVDDAYMITGLSAASANSYYQTPQNLALSNGQHTWTVRGLDMAGNWVQAAQTYSIIVDTTRVNIQPNGGEVIPGSTGQNHTYPITWTIENPPTNMHHITLSYSLDGGLTFPYLIADNEVNDGSFSWSVPNINSITARVKLQIKNSSDIILAEKSSAGNFTIDANPPNGSITLTAPLNGAWVSTTPYFDWSATGLTDVTNMAIIVDGLSIVQGLSTTSANSFYQTPVSLALSEGWHTWTVRGLDAAGNWVQATQSLSIRVDATPPSQFSLNTPTNDSWLASQTPTCIWNPSMDNGAGLAKYQVFVNNTLKKDNIAPTVTQW
ncbi:MAG: CRTAC1 family protein, partial [Syntrophomonadaceae bacterium]|nr:CRTAC1 family protein [Syntrophomonadaceae bacterium]